MTSCHLPFEGSKEAVFGLLVLSFPYTGDEMPSPRLEFLCARAASFSWHLIPKTRKPPLSERLLVTLLEVTSSGRHP